MSNNSIIPYTPDLNRPIIQILLPNFNETLSCSPIDEKYTGLFSKTQGKRTFENIRALVALSGTCKRLNTDCNAVYQAILQMPLKDRAIESAMFYWIAKKYGNYCTDHYGQFVMPLNNCDDLLNVVIQKENKETISRAIESITRLKLKTTDDLFNLINYTATPSFILLNIPNGSKQKPLFFTHDIIMQFCTNKFGTSKKSSLKRPPLLNLLNPLIDYLQKNQKNPRINPELLNFLEILIQTKEKYKTSTPNNKYIYIIAIIIAIAATAAALYQSAT